MEMKAKDCRLLVADRLLLLLLLFNANRKCVTKGRWNESTSRMAMEAKDRRLLVADQVLSLPLLLNDDDWNLLGKRL